MTSSTTLQVSIDCPPEQVARFVADPRNLPQWAAGLCRAIRQEGGRWLADTPQGTVAVRFVDANPFGILDHTVTLPDGQVVHVPMRVLANGQQSELLLTVLRLPGMSEEQLMADAALVARDLQALKCMLETRA